MRKRFGRLVAAHRARLGITQEALAERAGLSVDMISKIETGASGARFPAIERLAQALNVDPAQLFGPGFRPDASNSTEYEELASRLVALPSEELLWLTGIIEAALQPRQKARSPNRL
ncbi:helix-turn-helix transcriptional regulator [Aurantimonas sp. C2-3-R2]|nr:helix-turn-helix transcriptional regulator [Aurantimonas sp. C2-3-R2]